MFYRLRFDYRNETYVLNTNGTLFGVRKYWPDRSFSRETLIVRDLDLYKVYNDVELDADVGGAIDLYDSLQEALIETITFPARFDDMPEHLKSWIRRVVNDLYIELQIRDII